MSLIKQTVAVQLAGGLDLKSDPKQAIPGKLLTLENAVFTSTNRLTKRNGFGALGQFVLGSTHTKVDSGSGLATYLNELLLWDGDHLLSYDQTNGKWASKGPFSSVNVQLEPVVRNSYQQSAQDGALHSSGLSAYAWEDSQGGVRYSVVDSTGLNIVHDALVDASGSRPRVVPLGNYLVILYVKSTDSKLYSFPVRVAEPDQTPLAVALTPTSGTATGSMNGSTIAYDARDVQTVAGTFAYVAYNNQDGGGGITIGRLSPGGPTAFDATADSTFGSARAVAVAQDPANQSPTVAFASGGFVQYQTYDYLLSTRLASGTLESGSNASGTANIGAVEMDSASVRAYYTVTASLSQNFSVRTCAYSSASGPGTAAQVLRSVGLASKPFAYGDDTFVTVAHQSPTGSNLQTGYFVADQSGNLAAKAIYGLGGGFPSRNMLAGANSPDGMTFDVALLAKESTEISGGIAFGPIGVERARFALADNQDSFLRAELGENLHIGGGFVTMYDGVTPVEHGFHLFPEGLSASLQSTGGSINSGVHFYCQTYEWPDARGQVHRSAPSPAVQVSASTSTALVTATMPTLRLTAKADPRAPVQLVLYRTVADAPIAANGGLPNFYRVSSLTAPTANDRSVDTLTFTDTISDTALLANPPLYTNGGIVENIAAPPIGPIVVHKNRLFGIDTTAPSTVWFTKQVVPGTRVVEGAPAEWSDVFTISADPRGGDARALGSLDDNLVVFKKDTVFVVPGDGPTAAGAGGFGDPQLVTTDAGCTNQRSVVVTPIGLMFQSSKGIYLLSRQLQASYIGAPVEPYNDQLVTSAVLIPTTNQVRFTLDSGVALVYDYYAQQWGVFTKVDAVDSVVFGGLHTFLRSDGQVRRETPGVWSDAGSPIRMKLTTTWLQFAGIQGFQRVYKLLVLGEYDSPHRLRAGLAFDFDPAIKQTDYFDVTSILQQPQTYGLETPYGSVGPTLTGFGELPFGIGAFGGIAIPGDSVANPYGGPFPLYQFKIFASQQKCQAIQLTLEDIPTTAGEGMSLSAISVEYGAKKGLVRIPSSKAAG